MAAAARSLSWVGHSLLRTIQEMSHRLSHLRTCNLIGVSKEGSSPLPVTRAGGTADGGPRWHTHAAGRWCWVAAPPKTLAVSPSPAWSRSHQAPYGKWRLPRGLACCSSCDDPAHACLCHWLGGGPVGSVRHPWKALCCSPHHQPSVTVGKGHQNSRAERQGCLPQHAWARTLGWLVRWC